MKEKMKNKPEENVAKAPAFNILCMGTVTFAVSDLSGGQQLVIWWLAFRKDRLAGIT